MIVKTEPKISVVIPNYNRAEDLRRCLDSLVAQTFVNFEVLVCDDGSTDHSALVAAAYKDRLDLHFDTAINFGGPARPRNRGVALARAPFIAFLDSDDWWMPEKLAHSYAALMQGADVVYHDLFVVRLIDQKKFNEKIKSTPPRVPMFEALLCRGMSLPNSSVVTRKDLLLRIGGICEERELISVEDYDTWLSLAQITERFVRLPTCDGFYWMGGGNISAASPKQQTRIRSLYARHVSDLSVTSQRCAEGFLAFRVARIAQQHGDFDAARCSLLKAIRSPISPIYRLKAMYWFMHTIYADLARRCA